jgi:hypothetical protein
MKDTDDLPLPQRVDRLSRQTEQGGCAPGGNESPVELLEQTMQFRVAVLVFSFSHG